MCLIAIAHCAHPGYPLLVAANRDEFHDRPTRGSEFWEDAPELLAGRDLVAGGTWMGVTRGGRFAAVTNHRNPPGTPAEPRSRGLLTAQYLLGGMSAGDFLSRLAADAGRYAGFNLLLGEGDALWHFSNIDNRPRRLPPGIYSLSNATLDSGWPKQVLARRRLTETLAGPIDHPRLQATVGDRSPVADADLPDTGVGPEMERLLAPQFIVNGDYGTRSTTSLWRDAEGWVDWEENCYDKFGLLIESRPWQFR